MLGKLFAAVCIFGMLMSVLGCGTLTTHWTEAPDAFPFDHSKAICEAKGAIETDAGGWTPTPGITSGMEYMARYRSFFNLCMARHGWY